MYRNICCYTFVFFFLIPIFAFCNISFADNNSKVVGKTFFNIEQARRFGRGRIIGTILDRKGDPVENVEIVVGATGTDDGSQLIGPVLTNADGKFRIRRVPAGIYRVVAVLQEGDNLLSNDQFNVNVFDIIEPHISLAMAQKNEEDGIESDASNVIMNSCFSCHTDDEDFGVNRWNAWKAIVVE